ncbi:MAG: NAD(P)H-hydrate dehydratase [Bacteroidales bacterium]|nr:NAD(P)H-hydrate dehydratase [Bacteroidales bacterium]
MKISNVNEMRNMDYRATEEYGIPQEILMENAGQAAYFAILNEVGVKNKNFVVFCGVGNNGGDGLVVARKIYSSGGHVTAYIIGDPSKYKDAAKQNFSIVERTQIKIINLRDISLARKAVQSADIIIDAIFGTGLDRKVTGIHKDVIDILNTSQKTIFSLDIPSGVHGNSGQVMGTAVKANYTITFGLPKIGNILYPGFEQCGKLFVTHISFPPALQNTGEINIAVNDPKPIPARKKDSHKGNYGKTLFIAGASNYLGAPYFAALSFLKAGGGLSFLATPGNISAFVGNKGSEIVFIPQKNTTSGSISYENKQHLLQLAEKADMVVIGPGLSLNEETQTLVRELCSEIKKPLLIDGDGITAVANDPYCIVKRAAPTILTPHPGEMASITNLKTEDILKDKINILQETCLKLNTTIVLKGAHSLIGYPDKKVLINLSGNSGMAVAGSGDVLTGVIAAMAGLEFSIDDAVPMGVFIHGFAGDLAAKEKGEDGIIGSDIMEQLPVAMKAMRENFEAITADYYHNIYII